MPLTVQKIMKRTILVFDQTIKEHASHGNSTTREIRVVVHAIANFNTSGRVNVASQKGENIVLKSDKYTRHKNKIQHIQHHHGEP